MRQKLFVFLCALWCICYTQAQVSRTVNVSTPGTLASLVENEKNTITDLTVTGSINAADFNVFRQMSALKNLDLETVDCEEIPENGFYAKSFNSLKLPVSTKKIGPYAFYKTTGEVNLTKLINLDDIGEFCFGSSTAKVILPKHLKTTFRRDFYSFKGEVILPEGITKIASSSFSYANIQSLILPESISEIDEYAFYGAKVNNLKIPKNVTKLGVFCFGKTDLNGFDFSECKNIDIIPNNTFEFTSGDLDMTPFINLQSLGEFCFYKATTKVTLPKHLKSTFRRDFANFEGEVILPEGITKIADASFRDTNMEELILPESVAEIGSYTFSLSKIKKMKLPQKIESIKEFAFSEANISGIDFSKCQNVKTIDKFAFEKIAGELDLTSFSNLENIGEFCFNKATAKVTLPKHLKSTFWRDFHSFCGQVILPEGIEKIGSASFRDTNMEELILPESVTEIDTYAFAISKIKKMQLPPKVESIKEFTFSEADISGIDFSKCQNIKTIDRFAFEKITGELDFTPLSNLESIGEFCFDKAKIEHISIPISVTIIDRYAFNDCNNLQSITSSNTTPPQLGSLVFEGVDKENCILYVPQSSFNLYATADQWKDFFNMKNEGEIPLYFSSICEPDNIKDVEYTGIRIGEYLWTNSNLNHGIPQRYTTDEDKTFFPHWNAKSALFGHGAGAFRVTQTTLDRYMPCHLMDPAVYQLDDINDFEKYYGVYYNHDEIQYLSGFNSGDKRSLGYGRMKEGKNKVVNNSWKVPSQGDFAQLFAMCDFEGDYLAEQDVEFALGAKIGDNPLAMHLKSNNQVVGWFDRNKNTFGFNMMPSGGRIALEAEAWNNGLGPWWGEMGDLYHLFQAEYFHTMEDDGGIKSINIHDDITFYTSRTYKWQNTRYSRRLTPLELGYELYVNDDLTDIIKLDPTETPPNGYERLRNGYLRGFYVKYILDNPNPSKTVADIVELARRTVAGNTSDEGPGYPCDEYPSLISSGTKSLLRNATNIEQRNIESTSNKVSIYPNPVQNVLNIDSDNPIISVSILNPTGSLVKRFENGEQSFDVSDLSAGIYIIKVETKKGISSSKILKQ